MYLHTVPDELALISFTHALSKYILSRRYFLPHCSDAYVVGHTLFNLSYLGAVKTVERNYSLIPYF